MLRVFHTVADQHNHGLLALAAVVCLLAAHISVCLLAQHPGSNDRRRTLRLGLAILVFATGIWATHFISVFADRSGPAQDLDPSFAALALAIAIGGASLAFMLVLHPGNAMTKAVVPGIILAASIGAMHFVGVVALPMPLAEHYTIETIVVALGVGGACAITAMWLLSRGHIAAASLVLAVAVLASHFITMGSMTHEAPGSDDLAPAKVSQIILATAGGIAGTLIFVFALAASILNRRRSDHLATETRRLRFLADATFEGLVFERHGHIADVNLAICQLSGTEAAALIGLELADLLPNLALQSRPQQGPEETLMQLPNGQTRPVEVLWRDDPDRGFHVVAIRDLSREKAAESQIERLARFDPLTGLANRTLLEQQLRKALAVPACGAIAVFSIDIDRFDHITELFGPRAVEQILIQLAQRLSRLAQDTDTVARLERDEFALIQPLATQPAESAALAERIVAAMALPFPIDDHQPILVSINLGVALTDPDAGATVDILKHATLARRHARHDGQPWLYFEQEMDRQMRAKREMERDLRLALAEGRLCLHYQPFIAIHSHELAGYEALLRWDHPVRGRIAPADFIPLAEESGLIIPLGNWVLATACAEAASWDDPVTIAVNLSPAQFVQPGIVATVADVLQRTGLAPARLELEITEGTLMADTANALQILTEIKALGVKIAMDDFGTGYSSLSYLRKFPFDKLKIDRSFLSDLEGDAEAETIVQAIVALGRSLRLDITAEGVETERQLGLLSHLGCTYAQGYLLGRPHPADQLGQHIAKDWPIFDKPAYAI